MDVSPAKLPIAMNIKRGYNVSILILSIPAVIFAAIADRPRKVRAYRKSPCIYGRGRNRGRF